MTNKEKIQKALEITSDIECALFMADPDQKPTDAFNYSHPLVDGLISILEDLEGSI